MNPIHPTSLVEYSAIQKHKDLVKEASIHNLMLTKPKQGKSPKHQIHGLVPVLNFRLIKNWLWKTAT